MDHSHTHLCSGEVWAGGGGSYVGHILPGVFLLVWALHWFTSSTYASLTRRHNHAAAAHHNFWFLPRCLGESVEPLLKVVFPAVAIILEFQLSGTRYLRCPPGTVKAGELDVRHMNSWSHATNYPPIMLSGLVDLLHTHVMPLPAGVPHFFLSAAFGSSSFLMLAHVKSEALDALVHKLLGYCMAAVAAAVMAQGVVTAASGRGRGSYGLDAAKSLALVVEACWFLAIAHIMFAHDPTWSSSFAHDMTRVMFTPVLFAWIFIGALCFLLLLYVAMHVLLLGRCSSVGNRHPACVCADAAGSSCGGCGQRKGLWPWSYEQVGRHTHSKHEATQQGDDEASDLGSGSGESGSDVTSIEMV